MSRRRLAQHASSSLKELGRAGGNKPHAAEDGGPGIEPSTREISPAALPIELPPLEGYLPLPSRRPLSRAAGFPP